MYLFYKSLTKDTSKFQSDEKLTHRSKKKCGPKNQEAYNKKLLSFGYAAEIIRKCIATNSYWRKSE